MRRFLIPLLALVLVAVIAALVIWNKPHKKAENVKGFAVTAEALYTAYKNNEQEANAMYLNKVLIVSGTLMSQEKNQDGQGVAVLRGEASDDMLAGGVMCTMREKGTLIPEGNNITLKGFCTGFANDVHLTDCIIQNK